MKRHLAQLRHVALFSATAFFLLFATACAPEEPDLESNDPGVGLSMNVAQEEMRDYIVQHYGFNVDEISFDGERFLAEDVFFPEADFWENYTVPEGLTQTEDGSHKHYYNGSKVAAGTYYVNFGNLPSTWHSACRAALNDWNNLNLTVKIREKTQSWHPTDITISYFGFTCPSPHNWDRASTWGRGQYPVWRQTVYGSWKIHPGTYVHINSSYCGAGNYTKRRWLFKHEFGHNLGFKHTDSGSGTLLYSGIYPCRAYTDSRSVMRSTYRGYGYNFTSCDTDVFQRHY